MFTPKSSLNGRFGWKVAHWLVSIDRFFGTHARSFAMLVIFGLPMTALGILTANMWLLGIGLILSSPYFVWMVWNANGGYYYTQGFLESKLILFNTVSGFVPPGVAFFALLFIAKNTPDPTLKGKYVIAALLALFLVGPIFIFLTGLVTARLDVLTKMLSIAKANDETN